MTIARPNDHCHDQAGRLSGLASDAVCTCYNILEGSVSNNHIFELASWH